MRTTTSPAQARRLRTAALRFLQVCSINQPVHRGGGHQLGVHCLHLLVSEAAAIAEQLEVVQSPGWGDWGLRFCRLGQPGRSLGAPGQRSGQARVAARGLLRHHLLGGLLSARELEAASLPRVVDEGSSRLDVRQRDRREAAAAAAVSLAGSRAGSGEWSSV